MGVHKHLFVLCKWSVKLCRQRESYISELLYVKKNLIFNKTLRNVRTLFQSIRLAYYNFNIFASYFFKGASYYLLSTHESFEYFPHFASLRIVHKQRAITQEKLVMLRRLYCMCCCWCWLVYRKNCRGSACDIFVYITELNLYWNLDFYYNGLNLWTRKTLQLFKPIFIYLRQFKPQFSSDFFHVWVYCRFQSKREELISE